MAFERKSMEAIVQDMIDWSRGVSSKITDYRIGSRARTFLESPAKEIEELYDKVYRYTRKLIAESIYTVMAFPKLQAVSATGQVVFARATAADDNYLIPAGTLVKTKATATLAPVTFRTLSDAVLAIGEKTVTVSVISTISGIDGNVEIGSISDFVSKPAGVDTVTNLVAFTTGKAEETLDEQKNRFQKFIASLSRGTLQAIEYGSTTAQLTDGNGIIIERVVEAKTFEDLINRKGEVDCYVWNGTGTASPDLLSEVAKVLAGYYQNGKPVYGYKPAGIPVNLYSAKVKPVKMRLKLTLNSGASLSDTQTFINREVSDFFSGLTQGKELVQTALESRIKQLDSVYDIKIELSTDDGKTWTYNNLQAADTEILTPVFPLLYV